MAFNASDADTYFAGHNYDPYADSSILWSALAPVLGFNGTSKIDAMTDQVKEMNEFYDGKLPDGKDQWTYDDWLNYQDMMNNYNGKSDYMRIGETGKSMTTFEDFIFDQMDETGKHAAGYDTSRMIMKDFGTQNADVSWNDMVIKTASDTAREYYGKDYDRLTNAEKDDVFDVVQGKIISGDVSSGGRSRGLDSTIGGYNAANGGYKNQLFEQGLDIATDAAMFIPGIGPIGFVTKGAKAIGKGAIGAANKVGTKNAERIVEKAVGKASPEARAVDEAKTALDKAEKEIRQAARSGNVDEMRAAREGLTVARQKLANARKAAATDATETTAGTAAQTGAEAAAEIPVKEAAETTAQTAKKAATEGTKVSRGGSFKPKSNSSFKKGVRTVTGKHVKTSTPKHAQTNTGKHAKANTGKTESR